ncbi:Fur-regulated basic protein A [Bacillus sp. 166amftsu]|nr:Fur-regulated basic protein A [Bacillus sp. 166amftsu]
MISLFKYFITVEAILYKDIRKHVIKSPKKKSETDKLGGNMDRKQIFIDVLLHKGIYKEEDTGRQLYEMSEKELWNLLRGDEENETNRKRCL